MLLNMNYCIYIINSYFVKNNLYWYIIRNKLTLIGDPSRHALQPRAQTFVIANVNANVIELH